MCIFLFTSLQVFDCDECFRHSILGLCRWSRRWNGVITLVWLIIVLSVLLCGICSFLPQLFGKSEEILKLFTMMTLYTLLSVHYIIILCSKVRSLLKNSANRLFWTTTVNVRYLVKRAQILDMPNRGRCDPRSALPYSVVTFG